MAVRCWRPRGSACAHDWHAQLSLQQSQLAPAHARARSVSSSRSARAAADRKAPQTQALRGGATLELQGVLQRQPQSLLRRGVLRQRGSANTGEQVVPRPVGTTITPEAPDGVGMCDFMQMPLADGGGK